ncbi:MAG TPA: twin-arginine translocase TatA/TatE family subunit [Desulfurococcales archaeon]|nr:twin-arginine translocase TatA/TatE family subunit [Desulfurococcales archaeon]
MNGWLGPWELLLIIIIALILFGPKKIPEIARVLGQAVAEFRKASQVVYGVGEEVEYKKKGTESTLKVGDVEEDSKRKLKEVSYEERIMKLARKLNIQTENKSLNEIIDEIEAKLSRKEKVGESK